MRANSEKYSSSQQSPDEYLRHDYKYKNSLYAHMFIEDFCRSFSIEFSPLIQHDNFYDISPADDNLKQYLRFQDYHFFQYNFDKILDSIMYTLVLSGKAYVEVVTWKDQDNHIKGISFIPLNVAKAKEFRTSVLFKSTLHNGEKRVFKIDKKNLIVLDLRQIGFPRSYFRRLINKMGSLDLSPLSVIENSPQTGFNFTEYNKRRELRLLQLNNKTHWLGRNLQNQYLSESYLLYKVARYKILRLKFLDYIIAGFNNTLKRFEKEGSFTGKIVHAAPRIEYEIHLDALRKGEINTSQLGDILYSK